MNQLSTIEPQTEAEPKTVTVATTTAPSKEALLTEIAPVIAMADVIVIDSTAMYALAAEELKAVKAKAKALDEQRKGITRGLDTTKRLIMDLFRPAEDKLGQAASSLTSAMLAYDAEQEKKAAAEAALAQAAADEERAAMLEQAEEATEKGDFTTAMTLAATAEMVTAAPVSQASAPPRAQGVSKTVRWSAEETDKAAYLKHVLEHRMDLIDTIKLDMPALNKLAVALKANLNLPGIKAVSTTGLSSRS